MREVEKIIIYFENTTSSKELMAGDMDKDDVRFLDLRNIKQHIGSISVNSVEEYYMSDKVEIILNGKADKFYNEYGSRSNKTLFERIRDDLDIVSIEVYFTNRDKMEIFVPWNEEDNSVNYFQKSWLDGDGRLHIVIEE